MKTQNEPVNLTAPVTLALDRIRELEAEVERLRQSNIVLTDCRDRYKTDCEAAEAKLAAIGELPGKWRVSPAWDDTLRLADELEALLK